MPGPAMMWTLFAAVFIVLFFLTGLMILAALAGWLPQVRAEHLPVLVKAFLLEMAVAVIGFFAAGPPEPSQVAAVSTDPPSEDVYVVDRRGIPTSFKIMAEGDTLPLKTINAVSMGEVARAVRREGNALYVMSASAGASAGDPAVRLGRIETAPDSLVAWSISSRHALMIGQHLAEVVPPDGVRREPQTACRFLAIPFVGREDAPEAVKREAAGTLFHLRDACWTAGLGSVVLEAMNHRVGDQRFKELGDVLFGYANQPDVDRNVYFSQAASSYLRFIAVGCATQCVEVKRRVTDALPSVVSILGQEYQGRIQQALDTEVPFELQRLAADIETGVRSAQQ